MTRTATGVNVSKQIRSRSAVSILSKVDCAFSRQRVDVHRRLLSGHAEIVLADDVVAVEHAARDVAGDGHGDALGHARAHHVPRGGAAEVVEELVRDAGRTAGGGPRLLEIADGLTF